MYYKQVSITHIDQILPLIKDKTEFDVKYRDGYIAIDYVFEQETTFDNNMLLECRGIKFHPDGNIMARPFHKFFNVNQKDYTRVENLDFNIPHIIAEKLDGSMIHPAFIYKGDSDNGKIYELRLMTRAGITDVAEHAEKYLTSALMEFCVKCENHNITPMFEFVSPQNRIVIKYEESALIFLGAREKDTGRYIPKEEIMCWIKQYEIPHVRQYSLDIAKSPVDFLEHVRTLENQEGYVIQFESGAMVKVKAEDYVLKHRTKSYFDHEKNIFQIVMEDKIDDLISLLEHDDKERVLDYAQAVNHSMYEYAEFIIEIVKQSIGLSKKDFALGLVKEVPQKLQSVAFKVFVDRDLELKSVLEKIKQVFIKFASTQTTLDENRSLFNAKWM